jgi:VWFA-related protein
MAKPQTIKYFKAESDLPLTLGMLIDSSGSQMRVLDMEKEVGASFLESTLRPKDEAFVISFDVDITLLQDFTNSVSRLRHALNEAKINTGGVGCSGGPIGPQGPIPCSSTGQRGTALYDAVYLASHDEFSHEVGRKAMILLTDGEDEGSRLKIKDAIEAAQKADAICYVLLIADRGFYGFGGYHGDSEMKKLTQETGGRVIEVGNKIEKLRQAFDQISQELRSQYNIGYTPTNTARDGSFRKVEIKPKQGDYKIQARSGYYATPRHEDLGPEITHAGGTPMQQTRIFKLALPFLIALAALSGQAFASSVAVGLCAAPGTHYTTIQAAVTAASREPRFAFVLALTPSRY